MKAKILHYLKTDRTFESGLKLYQEHGKRMSFKTTLNRQGYSKANHDMMLRELAVENGISDNELLLILKTTVVKTAKALDTIIEEKIITSEHEAPIIQESEGKKILTVPEAIKKAIKLREQFPFLSTPECPVELKALVTDMYSDYDNYFKAHADLFKDLSTEEINAAAADCVENFLDNRAIWDELNYFNENKKILGTHPLFEEIEHEKEIRSMKTGDLTKLYSNLKNYILRDEKFIKDNPEHKKIDEKAKKIAGWKKDEIIVKSILGITE